MLGLARVFHGEEEIRRQVNLMSVAERLLGNDALSAAAVCDEIRDGDEAARVLRMQNARGAHPCG